MTRMDGRLLCQNTVITCLVFVDLTMFLPKSDSSSGSEVHYNIKNSDESLVVTTRAKSKAQEAAAATASPPQFDEGSDWAESYGDNPPTDNAKKGNSNAEEGNDDAEESRDDDTKVEEPNDKQSTAEQFNKQVGDSDPATTPEVRSKRWFTGLQICVLCRAQSQ
ncbi:hypothetical protein HAX54_011174 [Datura stramonium]|uniref:Uncharacterized protein n=1 Tax=Datura stramonium TaxID=4076 RepID=A0ABS8WYZ7_DATST|nr:hypothetical protein [Datura stramonium]